MRDVILTAFIGLLLPVILVQPVIGTYAWAWVSMMNPHKMTFGFAYNLPFAQAIAVCTMVGLLFTRKRKAIPITAPTVLLILLIVWMTLSSAMTINPPDTVWARWLFVIKIHVMLFVTLMLVRGREQLDLLIWVIVASVGFFGVKGGLWTALTGGGGRVWGPPDGMIAGNNELGVALLMLLPMMYYLHQTNQRRWVRWALAGAMLTTLFAILGSQSRGAFVGVLATALFLGFKGPYPVRTTLLILAAIGLAMMFMPESWTSRMETIADFQTDHSAMSRIYTWRTLWNVAMDRPLFGAGFGADTVDVFARYGPTSAEYAVFAGRAWVAHSIYFQALGEHGLVGFTLFIGIGIATWRCAGQVARRARTNPELAEWLPLLMNMCQVSLIAYASGGAFLSLMNLDLPYYLVAFVVIADVSTRLSRESPRPLGDAMRPTVHTPGGRA